MNNVKISVQKVEKQKVERLAIANLEARKKQMEDFNETTNTCQDSAVHENQQKKVQLSELRDLLDNKCSQIKKIVWRQTIWLPCRAPKS